MSSLIRNERAAMALRHAAEDSLVPGITLTCRRAEMTLEGAAGAHCRVGGLAKLNEEPHTYRRRRNPSVHAKGQLPNLLFAYRGRNFTDACGRPNFSGNRDQKSRSVERLAWLSERAS
jgi:hypothetical protein